MQKKTSSVLSILVRMFSAAGNRKIQVKKLRQWRNLLPCIIRGVEVGNFKVSLIGFNHVIRDPGVFCLSAFSTNSLLYMIVDMSFSLWSLSFPIYKMEVDMTPSSSLCFYPQACQDVRAASNITCSHNEPQSRSPLVWHWSMCIACSFHKPVLKGAWDCYDWLELIRDYLLGLGKSVLIPF